MSNEEEKEPNLLRVRLLAAKHQIHERTLLKALRGEHIRVLSVAGRAEKAVKEYREVPDEGDEEK